MLEGKYARRKIWSLIGLYSAKGPDWANIGRAFIKGILNSSRGVSNKDNSPAAQNARRINGLGDLDGVEFVARIDIEKDQNGDDKNVIKLAITPDNKEYASLMGAVADIMNTRPIDDAVVQHWKEKAGDRQTVVFCSTIEHARDVMASFISAGIATGMIWGDVSETDRSDTLAAYGKGDLRVIVNVAALTEGWGHPPTSCIVLLRPSSYKSAMIQMIGRGLRMVDPAEFPGIIKKDCTVLDFGTSTLMHGSLEQEVQLDDQFIEGTAPYKDCPECGADVPVAVKESSPWAMYVKVFLPL